MKAIKLFGKMLSFSRLKITSSNLDDVIQELGTIIKGDKADAPILVVLDSDVDIELPKLCDKLWQMNIQPIGVVAGVLDAQAHELQLPIFPADGKRLERLSPPKTTQQTVTQAPKGDSDSPTHDKDSVSGSDVLVQKTASEIHKDTPIQADDTPTPSHHQITSNIHTQMLRSGQSLQHLGGDLIIVGGVNKGAEAITDNNLHIYGHGHGRLVAGATGDKDARIFCQKFNPTLVSVAGTYCLSDAIPPEMIDKAVQVSFDETHGLVFTLMP